MPTTEPIHKFLHAACRQRILSFYLVGTSGSTTPRGAAAGGLTTGGLTTGGLPGLWWWGGLTAGGL